MSQEISLHLLRKPDPYAVDSLIRDLVYHFTE